MPQLHPEVVRVLEKGITTTEVPSKSIWARPPVRISTASPRDADRKIIQNWADHKLALKKALETGELNPIAKQYLKNEFSRLNVQPKTEQSREILAVLEAALNPR
ncbi:MAG: hypothetical protein WC607_00610 [Candidatus Micrarchaeia archaeon]